MPPVSEIQISSFLYLKVFIFTAVSDCGKLGVVQFSQSRVFYAAISLFVNTVNSI